MNEQPPRVVVLHSGARPPWAPADAELVEPPLNDGAHRYDVVLVDAATTDALRTVRQVRTVDPALHVIIVTSPGGADALQRAITFAPGAGELWLESAAAVDRELLQRAAEVTRQKRSYSATRLQLERMLSGMPPPQRTGLHVSDAYLAALVQVLPDPIFSVDEDGVVLSASPAAQTQLMPDPPQLTGRPLEALVAPVNPEAFATLLADGAAGTVRGELDWLRRDGATRSAELVVTPVVIGERRIRAVVMRDTTDQRAAQRQREELAAELEAQTVELGEQSEELARQRDELVRLVQARSRFYASMSHEIRTPINAILGYNDLLLAGIYGELSEEQAQGLERAQSAARHLRELVNDVLDLSKLESGKLVVSPESVVLGELVHEIVTTILPLAREHGSELNCSLDEEIRLETDPRRVRQIVLNLLSNAVKFGAGRPIDVSIGTLGDSRAYVEVRDRGRGIDPEELDRVFDEFVQIGSVEGGTGLGLSISKRLAIALGGSLSAASAPGLGSTFTLALPVPRSTGS